MATALAHAAVVRLLYWPRARLCCRCVRSPMATASMVLHALCSVFGWKWSERKLSEGEGIERGIRGCLY
ncbi:hypothetical protein SORBI_3004G346600 [Sorghum bicolor]|uniref:Uncharacterized protein n=1 Tax=Sorghum bicolor TaxID=4558 RepID=A0A194YSZ9_SORBI|nr:hypothetical protein SORBI_3004G346600 [Sorghum bicolor]